MSGETEKQVSAWTSDTLKEYVEVLVRTSETRLKAALEAAEKANQQRFDAQQQGVKDALTAQKEAVAAALVAAEKAVLVAENNADKWRMNANEWRGSMLDRETKFASRIEVDAKFETMNAQIAGLEKHQAIIAGEKGGKLSQQQLLMAIVSLIVALIVIGGVVVGIAYAVRGG